MHTLKNPSFFRPISRPSSPAPSTSRPDSGIGFERARPPNRLSLQTFRRQSPAPPTVAPMTLVQDGSYLEMLNLKLSEAVTKALTHPTGPPTANDVLGGRRPIPAGRGHDLGLLIASELTATNDNSHLQKAILRSLHKPLSVLLSNLSSLVLPILLSPAFLTPPAPTPQIPSHNATQLHGLAIAAFAGELLETFDAFTLGQDVDVRGDNLRFIREGLVSVVNRVINPLIGGIKTELLAALDGLENPGLVSPVKPLNGNKSVQHASVATLVATIPLYAQALKRYTFSVVGQEALAPFILSLVWRAMVALSSRPYVVPTFPSSPGLSPAVLPGIRIRRGSPTSSPPSTPPPTRFTIKLSSSRPPSPPAPLIHVQTSTVGDTRAIHNLLRMLPLPEEKMARDAVEEALNGLQALAHFLEVVGSILKASDRSVEGRARELTEVTEKIPTLIALPILMNAEAQNGSEGRSVSSILGVSEGEYRSGCLTGFGRADELSTAVGKRVRTYLEAEQKAVLLHWLETEIEEDD
ncbi:hypothetical protein E1B28_009978 [Marasmius oreades]|uniref:Uncharacterized protein n=1 Tax=Marasmius oreades TaxID=181124 RepID=A0A9P7RW81_9AGAR|nr:uncharacterized protein E1B28_009978 [Marasmius oreades]KAG7090899.1 hypothetical protein E1B28_009978 [Marasmius oreades]